METLNLNQGFPWIRKTFKYFIIFFFTICQIKIKGTSVLENVALLEIFFLLLGPLLLMAQFYLVPADILKNYDMHPVLLGK